MFRNQCLVCCDHVLPLLDGQLDQLMGNGGAANQFNNHINIGISRHIHHFATDFCVAIEVVRVVSACANMRHTEFSPASRCQQGQLILQDRNRSEAHGAHATDTNSQRRHLGHADRVSVTAGGP